MSCSVVAPIAKDELFVFFCFCLAGRFENYLSESHL